MRAAAAAVLIVAPLRQFPGRTLVATVAIALGVALGLAVQLANSAALQEFGQAARRLSGTADVVVRGPSSGFDEALFARIAAMPEVAVASPVVEVEAPLADRPEETLRIAGIDVFRAARLQPALVTEEADALDLLRPDSSSRRATGCVCVPGSLSWRCASRVCSQRTRRRSMWR
jgi:putative ABC transport system permease protein